MSDPLAFAEADDSYHQLSNDPYETETNWWSWNVPERRIGGWIHTPYYPNRKTVTWRIFAWGPDGYDPARMAYYRKVEEVAMPDSPDLRDITFPGGGYSLKMIEPGMKYHLAYVDEARDFALDFTFEGAHPPRRFEPGEPPFIQTPHYDQLGRVTGTMRLRGEDISVDCWSVRDRTWGPRGGPYAKSRKQSYASDLDRVLHPGGARWREIERERGRGRIQYIFGHADGQPRCSPGSSPSASYAQADTTPGSTSRRCTALPDRDGRVDVLGGRGRWDAAVGGREPVAGAAPAAGDDLGGDADRGLLGRAGPEVEPDGAGEPGQLRPRSARPRGAGRAGRCGYDGTPSRRRRRPRGCAAPSPAPARRTSGRG